MKCPESGGMESQGREEGGRSRGEISRPDMSQRNGSVTESPVDSNVSTKDTIIMRTSAEEDSPSFSAAAFSRSLVSVSNRMGMALSFNMVRTPYHTLIPLARGGRGAAGAQRRHFPPAETAGLPSVYQCITPYPVNWTENDEVMWVRMPRPLRERLEALACQLHCTPSEAASLAIRAELDRIPEAVGGKDGQTGAAPGGEPATVVD